jgi:multiple sugar transport system substrate-binding protein
MNTKQLRRTIYIVILSLFISACGSAPLLEPTPGPTPTLTLRPEWEGPYASSTITPTQGVPVVWLEDSHGWLYGEEAPGWVKEFNAAHDDIELELYREHGGISLVDGWRNRRLQGIEMDWPFPDIAPYAPARMYGQWDVWLDLTPHLQEYDLSVFHPAALRQWQDKDGNQFGLPVSVYAPILVYNRDLFDAAGIPYPPHGYGEPYADGEEWNIEKMEEIAILLTLDVNGRNPTHPDFNAQDIVQFGFTPQWLPLADIAALFGTDAVFDGSGPVSLTGVWSEALHWYHSGIWEKHFIPNAEQIIGIDGNAFASGRVAMAYSQTWYFCCIEPTIYWDLAALPSHNGRVTASLVSDGFGILDISPQPEAAVETLYYLVTLPELNEHAQGLPVLKALQPAEFSEWEEKFPQRVDWQVAKDSLTFPEFAVQPYCAPRLSRFEYRIIEFMDGITSSPLPDVDAALGELTADLQAIMQEWEELSCL